MLIPRVYFLQEDEQLLVKAITKRRTIQGPRVVVSRPHWQVQRQKGITLGPTEYAQIRNELSGELHNVYGPALLFPDVAEKVVRQTKAITLKHNEYMRIIDQQTGQIRVERGEAAVTLQPTEEVLQEPSVGISVDNETAVLVRNTSDGQVTLVTEPQIFIPRADQEIHDVRQRIRLENHEALIIKDRAGKYIFKRGQGESEQSGERSFFLEPYEEVVTQHWSGGIHKDTKSLHITKFDLRPKFMWYEFEARTRDNVELIIGITFFWEIEDLEKLVAATHDAPGDLCSFARSHILQSISQASFEEFLAGFNDIIRIAIFENASTFYANRGINLHAVEVRSVHSKDPETQRVLQEIINETTNRINRLQKQESENEVRLKKIQGDIETEQMRSQLLELKREHAQMEGLSEGEAEALRVKAFFDGLGESLSPDAKIQLFSTLRKQDALFALSSGNSQLFFTPSDVDLKIQTA